MDLFQDVGTFVSSLDPDEPVIKPTREHPHWSGTKSVSWHKETISPSRAAIIATTRGNVNYQELENWLKIVVDTRNATDTLSKNSNVVEAEHLRP